MEKYNFYKFIFTIFLINFINGEKMTKDEVLKIDVQKYNNIEGLKESICPNYSVPITKRNKCSFDFFCREDECFSKDVDDRTVDTDVNTKLITKLYNQERDSFLYCYNDSECLSNKCQDNVCVPNPNLRTYKCQDVNILDKVNKKYTTKMKCGLVPLENCKTDDECFYGKCQEDGRCSYTDEKEWVFNNLQDYKAPMNKNDVLNLDIDKYNKDDDPDCPHDYSFYDYKNVCSVEFYCLGEKCYPLTSHENLIQLEPNSEHLITTVCDENNLEHCTLFKCTKDSECLSKKCVNNICMTNEAFPLYQCMDIYDEKEKKGLIKCGKATGEKCTINDDCASNECKEGFCVDTNHSHQIIRTSGPPSLSFKTLIIGGISIVLILIIIIKICCCKSRRNKE